LPQGKGEACSSLEREKKKKKRARGKGRESRGKGFFAKYAPAGKKKQLWEKGGVIPRRTKKGVARKCRLGNGKGKTERAKKKKEKTKKRGRLHSKKPGAIGGGKKFFRAREGGGARLKKLEGGENGISKSERSVFFSKGGGETPTFW